MAAELILTHNFNGDCLLCGCTPLDELEPNRPTLPMIHQVGGDVNWGEQVNICQVCAGVIADLIDRPEAGKIEKLQTALTSVREKYEATAQELEETKVKIDKYVKGRKAEKELIDA